MAARPRRIRFRSEQTINEWSEGDIRMLLMARAAASGVVHQFEDLVVDAAQSDAALVRSSESYVRLIWDYADGCPEVACHFWLRSLVYVADDRVRVRLFSAPNGTRLERLPEEARFVYAALVTHDALSAEHVARVLRVERVARGSDAATRARRGPARSRPRHGPVPRECSLVPGGRALPAKAQRDLRSPPWTPPKSSN